jgi:hypothetical protein
MEVNEAVNVQYDESDNNNNNNIINQLQNTTLDVQDKMNEDQKSVDKEVEEENDDDNIGILGGSSVKNMSDYARRDNGECSSDEEDEEKINEENDNDNEGNAYQKSVSSGDSGGEDEMKYEAVGDEEEFGEFESSSVTCPIIMTGPSNGNSNNNTSEWCEGDEREEVKQGDDSRTLPQSNAPRIPPLTNCNIL